MIMRDFMINAVAISLYALIAFAALWFVVGFVRGYLGHQTPSLQNHSSDTIKFNAPDDEIVMFHQNTINPASGLPMIDHVLDTAGNVYGFNEHIFSHK